MLAQQQSQKMEGAAFVLFAMASALDLNRVAPRPQPHVRPRSEEGIAPNLLAALNRFQEKSVGLVFCDRKKRGDRRQEIGAYRLHHRHQRRRARQARELFVIRADHEQDKACAARFTEP